MWGYYSAYTSAQIELMAADVPLVLYKSKKEKKNGRSEPAGVVPGAVESAAERWKEKYRDNKGGKFSLDLSKYKPL